MFSQHSDFVQNDLARFGLCHRLGLFVECGGAVVSRKMREREEGRSAGAQVGKGKVSGSGKFSVRRG